ncbi:MAG: hypothetical protein ABGX27_07135 [Desulfurobacteriaceae bacterium]
MIRKLLLSTITGVFFLNPSFANEENHFFIKYFYYLAKDKEPVGMILLEKTENTLSSSYIQVSQSLPFFAPQKEIVLDNRGRIIVFKTGKGIFKVSYDLSDFKKRFLRRVGIFRPQQQALIYNPKKRFYIAIEKFPVLNVDTLILALINHQSLEGKDFYIYEPYKPILIKATAEKRGNTIYILGYKRGRKIKLFEILLDEKGIPIKLISGRKKWRFELKGLGEKEKKNLKLIEIVKKRIEQEITDSLQDRNEKLKVAFKGYKRKNSKYLFYFEAEKNPILAPEELKNLVYQKLTLPESILKEGYLREKNGFIQFEIPSRSVCDLLRNREKGLSRNCQERFFSLLVEDIPLSNFKGCKVEKGMFRTSVNCQDGSFKEKLKNYLITSTEYIPKNATIEKVDYKLKSPEESLTADSEGWTVDVEVEYKTPFDFDKYALKELKSYTNLPIKKMDDRYVITVEKKEKIMKNACESYKDVLSIPHSQVKTLFISPASCQVKIEYKIPTSRFRSIAKENLYKLYPDLKWTNAKLKWHKDSVEFEYVKEYQGETK